MATREGLLELLKQRRTRQQNKASSNGTAGDRRAAVLELLKKKRGTGVTAATEGTDERTWFQKGAYEDGYQLGDFTKTILGTGTDAAENLGTGILGMGEKFVDVMAYMAPVVEHTQFLQGGGYYNLDLQKRHEEDQKRKKQDVSEFIAKDLYDEEKLAKAIISEPMKQATGIDAEKDSVLGEKTDSLVQSAGQLAGRLGMQAVGVPWWLTIGATTFGGDTENAFREGATYEEAGLSGVISAGAEILTEKISGGIKFGKMGTLDDAVTKRIASGISNKVGRTFAKLGMDVVGEGTEEVLSGVISKFGQWLTYKDDQELGKLLFSEEAMDEAVESFIGGAVLGGVGGGVQAVKAASKGADYASGLTKNEQAVVDKVYKDAVAEAEKEGKVSQKRKNEIFDQVIEQMDRGEIDIDTIEQVLGGSERSRYDALAKEAKEFDTLNSMESGKLTGKQVDRLAELKDKNRAASYENAMKEAREKISRGVSEMVRSDRLAESYAERGRKGQAFQADVSQYDERQRATVQAAIDSGILNNTRRAHEFVDLVAKISADKGVAFNFADNKKLQETGFALEGVTVNGFVNSNGVTVNVNSAKALNSVVGHEIAHVLEGTELYDGLKTAITQYAESKGDYKTRLAQLTKLYEGKEGYEGADAAAKIQREVVADLVGDYLFTDKEFVSRLSTENRNVFEKIFDEVKYLCRIATAGSKEARQLEKVKKAFEEAYRAEGTKNPTGDGGAQYSLVGRAADGSGIYKANYPPNTPKAVKQTDLISLVQNAWSNEPITLEIVENGEYKDIVAKFNPELETRSDLAKIAFGNRKGTAAEQRMTLDLASDLYQIASEAKFRYSKDAIPKPDNPAHDGVTKYHYFITNLIYKSHDGAYIPCHMNIDVKRNADGEWFYSFAIEKGSAPQTLLAAVTENSATLPNDSIDESAPDVNNKKSQAEITDAQNEKGLDAQQEAIFSLSNDTAYMDKAISANNSALRVDPGVMTEAKAARERVAARMNAIKDKGLVGLPEDIEGNTYIANSSYDGTEENTTICPRSLASEAFVDAVSEYLGRPLTVEEQIYISQDLQGRSMTPECTYCYVATDGKAYRAFLGEYIKQRDAVLQKLKADPDADVTRSGALYKEFLNGRKDTEPMYKRFKMWVDAYRKGTPMVDASHLANISKLMGDINSEFGEALRPQIVDAMKYAQSASWAKKRVNYVAYNGHILKWKQDRINKLNGHYGLRMYSFSDFHPAFVLENMQMITDAAVRGLKMLGYTKDTDFVEIFAPTGMNINVSTFGFSSGGNVYENNIIGAEWEKAKALREKHPNVGVTFVATNDTLVEWALAQDWIDVVIPYHLVRTGAEVAKAFGYTNYTSESADTKDTGWAKGKDKKYIAPTEHNNDKATYLAALEKNHLKPRFERFLDNPNYMKLVNECRQSASESKPVQPVFDEDAAMRALAKLEANGYYQPIGGSVDRMYEIAAEVAEDMRKEIAPVMSLSGESDTDSPFPLPWTIKGEDVGLQEFPLPEGYIQEQADAGQENSFPLPPGVEEVAKTAEVLVHEDDGKQTFGDKLRGAWEGTKKTANTIMTNFADKGWVFENLAKKTNNRELEAKYNFLHYSESRAQQYIKENLIPLRDAVKKTGKTKEVYEYVYHLHNIDRMSLEQPKPVFGDGVTADVSREKVRQLEAENPEFVELEKAIVEYNTQLRNMLVDGGVISQETADKWEKMYPHYVPIRRAGKEGLAVNVPLDTGRTGINAPVKGAKGGNSDIEDLIDTMALRTEQTFKAIAKNSFGLELMHTLGAPSAQEKTTMDTILDSFDSHEDLLQEGKNGKSPTFTVFENGEKITFEITKEMYDAMKPTSENLAKTYKLPNAISNFHRGLLTDKNPAFLITNAIKDAQDVLINSQHAAKTYGNFPAAIKELASQGKWYQEYIANGGEQNTYFEGDSKTFAEEPTGIRKWVGKISDANNFVERVPRMAEYIASRKQGKSIEVAMLDAARVTTNFSAGGDVTKFLNRNGATFLNASVQGAMQQVRNIREANSQGLKGWAILAAKAAGIGLSGLLVNHLLWDDDEDYEDLSDYVKQNYYVIAKTGDGQFVRIPKGRTLAVIQEAFTQMENLITGNDEVDLATFADLVITNLAPNNPIDNNILAPIMQVANNTTWYGEDLVPTRLQDVPEAEQYDESIDVFSKWLGEKTDYSPYKINYLLNQYSGALGDVILPYLTPEAEGSLTGAAKVLAPFVDKFTTDSVMNNQNVSDFYDMLDALLVNANSMHATDEDTLKSKYMNAKNADLSNLYKLKREIQNSDLPEAEKFAQVRELQEQINALAEGSLDSYDGVSIQGAYATVGDLQFRWYEPGEDSTAEPGWKKLTGDQIAKQEEVTSGLGISPSEYWSSKAEYDYAYENPGKYAVAQAVGGYDSYKVYREELGKIKGDEDVSRKQKVTAYINSLDAEYGEKIILYVSQYPSKESRRMYGYEIVDYLNGRSDIRYSQMVAILQELGFEVSADGKVTWD